MRIFIMGLTPFAHNRGVSAMVSTTINEIKEVFPDCEIFFWGGFPEPDLPLPTSMEYKNYKSSIKYTKSKWDLSFYRQIFWMPFRLLSILTKGKLPSNPVVRELTESDVVISFNYGDIFSDVHSVFNIATILRNILPILGKKQIIFGPQTIGPFRRKSFEFVAKIILNNTRVKIIMPRDPMSRRWVEKNVYPREKITFCPDMAFLLKPVSTPSVITQDILETGYITVALNPYQVPPGYYQETTKILGTILNDIINKTGKYVVFVPHATAEGFDCRNMAEDISKYITRKEMLVIIKEDTYTTEELKAIIANSDVLISFLTHPIIAALSSEVPVIGISSKSPKMQPIMSIYKMETSVVPLFSLLERPEVLKHKLEILLNPKTKKKLSIMLKNKQRIVEPLVRKKFREALGNANS